jgi:hypothetical protein
MKKLLFLLMMVASVASAHPKMSDAKIKSLIIGTWKSGGISDASGGIEYKADGTVDYGKDLGSAKWTIKDGDMLEIPEAPERTYYYKILYLTRTALLMKGMTPHGKGYFFYYRKPEDVPDDVPDSVYLSKPDEDE